MSVLAEGESCLRGLNLLINKIQNGTIPEPVHDHITGTRLIPLGNKINKNKVRPIAVPEMLYKVAASHAKNKITSEALEQLTPHQFAVGVNNGCEKIIHAIQHSLTNKEQRVAMMSVDFTNAFNTISRAHILKTLYATPSLSSIW
jgi:3-oxoacyl-[acyl-carrier-protein] synthase III